VAGVASIAAALALGTAVGLFNNLISQWVYRLTDRKESSRGASLEDRPAGPGGPPASAGSWPALFAAQFVLRLVLSVLSLYAAYRIFDGSPGPVLANLAGLLATRYMLLWRLTHSGAGGVA